MTPVSFEIHLYVFRLLVYIVDRIISKIENYHLLSEEIDACSSSQRRSEGYLCVPGKVGFILEYLFIYFIFF